MIITCEACNTSFNLDEKMLKPEGSKVRCSVCSAVFTAYPKQVSPPENHDDRETMDPESVDSKSSVVDGDSVENPVVNRTVSEQVDPDLSFDEELNVEDSGEETEAIDEPKEKEQTSIEEELDAELDLFLDSESSDPMDESDATMIADLNDELDLSLDAKSDEDGTNLSDFDEDDFELDVPLLPEDDLEGTETIIADLDDDPLSSEDDLDLSGLETILDDDEDNAEKSEAETVEEEDPILSLNLDEDLLLENEDKAGLQEDGVDKLELNLESDDIPDDDDATGIDDEEIDLSEIEKMLGEPAGDVDKTIAVPEQDLDLEVESGLEAEKWMSKNGEEDNLTQDEEIDLTELEEVIEDVDLDTESQVAEEPELDLDIQESVEAEIPEDASGEPEDLELNFSDLEDNLQFIDGKKDDEEEVDDIDLKFEVESDSRAEQTLEDEPLTESVLETVPEPEPAAAEIPPPPPEPVGDFAEKAVAEPAKKGTSKLLVFLLIVVLLGGGGYGAYYYAIQQGIEIPFLSNYLKPKVDDPGNLKLSTLEINSKFLDNANVGKLFVITGKVKNGYSESRGMITIEGKLFSSGKVPVNHEKVYCGNIMSDLELSNLEWDKIKARLSNRLGDNRSNVKIEPGETIPFMVVFSGLPDDLEEFTIEVTGSTVLN